MLTAHRNQTIVSPLLVFQMCIVVFFRLFLFLFLLFRSSSLYIYIYMLFRRDFFGSSLFSFFFSLFVRNFFVFFVFFRSFCIGMSLEATFIYSSPLIHPPAHLPLGYFILNVNIVDVEYTIRNSANFTAIAVRSLLIYLR